jgi:hypothetical protein
VNVLDSIRPRAEHLTDERSDGLLRSVLAAPRPRRKRRWSRAAAFGLCGVIVAGGTAYAAGGVLEIVVDSFQQIRQGSDGWPDPIYGERLIADVPLSKGKTARVWFADTTNGQCVIRDMTGSVTEPEGFGVGCAHWGAGAEKNDPRRGGHWQTAVDGPALVYGDFEGVPLTVARVRIAGPGWTRSFPVRNGAFAGEVPAGADGDRLVFTYLDERGDLIATKVVTVAIESE